MFIDFGELEQFKVWLNEELNILSDADPKALAKYVLAVIRKDTTEEDLRQYLTNQLSVFLRLETSAFVERVFKVLKTKDYSGAKKPDKMETEQSSISQDDSSSDEGEVNSSSSSDHSTKSTSKGRIGRGFISSRYGLSKKNTEDRDRDKSRKFKPQSPRSTRLRSRSRNSRSYNTMEYRGRNRKPLQSQRQERHLWNRSSFSYRRSPFTRNRPSSPCSPRTSHWSKRSRSRSPLPSRSPHGFCRDRDSDDGKMVKSDDDMKESPPPGDRCRDYDEKGLCLRGDLCPFNHGNNPVVLQDTRLILQNKDQIEMYSRSSPTPKIIRAPRPWFGDSPFPLIHNNHNFGWVPQYRPRSVMMGGPRPGLMRFNHPPPHPRFLVDVPVSGIGIPSSGGPDMNMNPMHLGMAPHNQPIPMGGHFPAFGRGTRGRLGFDRRRLGAKSLKNNCSLEVKNIPRAMNTIMELNSHFWKFGKIINIQINFASDPEAALVTFSTPEEAYTAFKATEAVMNNRFIRLFWHHNEERVEPAAAIENQLPVKNRLGEYSINSEENTNEEAVSEKIIMSGNNITKTVYNYFAPYPKKELSAERAEEVEAIRKSQELLRAQEILRKANEEKKTEAIKLMNDLRIRKGAMLIELLEQQKKLIRKLEENKNTVTHDEKEQLMDLLTSLQAKTEEIKKDLEDFDEKTKQPMKSKAETRKEILDGELDLYHKEIPRGEIRPHKVNQFRAQTPGTRIFNRGRGSYKWSRGLPAGGYGGSTRNVHNLDHRTTRICITGYPVSRQSEILEYFKQFGSIQSFDSDLLVPYLIITYMDRKSAEFAKSNNGKFFAGIQFDIQWVAKDSILTTAVTTNNEDNDRDGSMTMTQQASDSPSEVPEEDE